VSVHRPWSATAERVIQQRDSTLPAWSLARWLAGITLGQLDEPQRQDNSRLLANEGRGNLTTYLRSLLVEALEARLLDRTTPIDVSRLDEVLPTALTEVDADSDAYVNEIADWLAIELLNGDATRISRALQASRQLSPAGLCGEIHAPLQMLARGDMPSFGSRDTEAMFWGAYFFGRFDPTQTLIRELADGDDPNAWRCWDAARIMDDRLVKDDGRTKAYADKPRQWQLGAQTSALHEFRYPISLVGQGRLDALTLASGDVFCNPWEPIELLLDPKYHKRVCPGRGTHKLLRDAKARVLLVVTPSEQLSIEPEAFAAFQRWFLAGLPWIKHRHGWFVGELGVCLGDKET
jgi:hypothetical protein